MLKFRFITIYGEIFEFEDINWSKAWHRVRHITRYKKKDFTSWEVYNHE